jgi:DNA-binding FadR family transcriptional regulator
MTDVAGQPHAASRGPEDVRRVLAERISAGRLRPGQRLGAERALAAELGVSRATLRQALAAIGLRRSGCMAPQRARPSTRVRSALGRGQVQASVRASTR